MNRGAEWRASLVDFSHHCVVPSLLASLGRVPVEPGFKAVVLCSIL